MISSPEQHIYTTDTDIIFRAGRLEVIFDVGSVALARFKILDRHATLWLEILPRRWRRWSVEDGPYNIWRWYRFGPFALLAFLKDIDDL